MRKLLLLTTVLLLPLSVAADDFRGAWIASVHNINFPSSQGLSLDGQKAQIIRLLDAAKRCRLNALMVQVRPESDALYPSRIEPWSRYLSGTQGVSPGYDPLAFFISEAKKRGIEVHAWLNPYRGAANASLPRAANHISRRYPQYAYRIGTVLWMDPGAPAVQENIVNVVQELVERYEIAGIHFDDYFYPYPTDKGHVYPFPDDATYAAYRARGGTLSKAGLAEGQCQHAHPPSCPGGPFAASRSQVRRQSIRHLYAGSSGGHSGGCEPIRTTLWRSCQMDARRMDRLPCASIVLA